MYYPSVLGCRSPQYSVRRKGPWAHGWQGLCEQTHSCRRWRWGHTGHLFHGIVLSCGNACSLDFRRQGWGDVFQKAARVNGSLREQRPPESMLSRVPIREACSAGSAVSLRSGVFSLHNRCAAVGRRAWPPEARGRQQVMHRVRKSCVAPIPIPNAR